MLSANFCDSTLRWKVMTYFSNPNLFRSLATGTSKQELMKCCHILKVPMDSNMEEIRIAFIALAKKYHPDSGSPDADAEKFQEVESAYRMLHAKYSKEEKNWKPSDLNEENHVEEQNIKHTAPQHRQYLSYDGYGSGTPSQRQKQFYKQRAVEAADNVMSHRIHKMSLNCSHNREEALAVKDKVEAKKIKTRYGMDRLVEDLIQESMAKGDFSNLPGEGKPLKQGTANPYVDFTTHKLNEVLIDNGFVPEWILLQKEIREERDRLRCCLIDKRKTLGPLPLSPHDEHLWKLFIESCHPLVQQLNSKINKYNLLVPILHKKILQVQLNKEATKILQEVKGENLIVTKLGKGKGEKDGGFLDIIYEIFGNK